MTEILELILTYEFLFGAIAVLIGFIAAKTGIELLADLQSIIKTVADAVDKESEEGRQLSPSERDEIREQVYELAKKTWKKYRAGIIPGILKGISKLKFWGK